MSQQNSVSTGGQPQNGMGTAALILGILQFVCLGTIGSILANVFGKIGMNRADQGLATNRGAAKAGFVLGRICVNLTNFSGRASRSEFWWFYLFIVIVGTILSIIASATGASSGSGGGVITFILLVVLGLASLSVSVRRLHDTNKSGWLVLLNLLPCIGPIILIVFWVQPSTEGDNSHGPRPTA